MTNFLRKFYFKNNLLETKVTRKFNGDRQSMLPNYINLKVYKLLDIKKNMFNNDRKGWLD